jgi:hypothetical protein
MKKLGLAMIIGALLVGGTGLASGSPMATKPPKPSVDLGDQTQARVVLEPMAVGRNPSVKREYTELAAPCRLYDSRSSSPLASGSTRVIAMTKCPAIPFTATSLTVSLSAINPAHPGYMRIWANGKTEPTQTVLQWGSTSTTTGAAIQADSSGLKAHSFGGPTDLVIDVSGYWTEPIYADVLTASTTAFADVYSSTGMISGWSSALGSPGQIVISVRRNLQYCDIQATAEVAGYTASAVIYDNTSYLVQLRDPANNPARGYVSTIVTC